MEGTVAIALGTGAVGGFLLDERKAGGGLVTLRALPLATRGPRVVLKDLVAQPAEGPAVGDDVVRLDMQMCDVRALHQQRGFDQGAAVRERQRHRQRAPHPLGARDVRFGLLREVHPADPEAPLPRHPLKGRPRLFTEPQPERLVARQHMLDALGERIEIDPAPQSFVNDAVELRRLRSLRTGGLNIALVRRQRVLPMQRVLRTAFHLRLRLREGRSGNRGPFHAADHAASRLGKSVDSVAKTAPVVAGMASFVPALAGRSAGELRGPKKARTAP